MASISPLVPVMPADALTARNLPRNLLLGVRVVRMAGSTHRLPRAQMGPSCHLRPRWGPCKPRPWQLLPAPAPEAPAGCRSDHRCGIVVGASLPRKDNFLEMRIYLLTEVFAYLAEKAYVYPLSGQNVK